jgi:competence protein ComGC
VPTIHKQCKIQCRNQHPCHTLLLLLLLLLMLLLLLLLQVPATGCSG